MRYAHHKWTTGDKLEKQLLGTFLVNRGDIALLHHLHTCRRPAISLIYVSACRKSFDLLASYFRMAGKELPEEFLPIRTGLYGGITEREGVTSKVSFEAPANHDLIPKRQDGSTIYIAEGGVMTVHTNEFNFALIALGFEFDYQGNPKGQLGFTKELIAAQA